MAPSQVEIASPSPFHGVLQDHNPCHAYTTHDTFQKNIKNFVKDHLNTCNVSISSDSSPNQNTQKPITKADTWVSRVAKNNLGNLSFTRNHNICGDKDDSSLSALVSPRHTRITDGRAERQTQEMVSKFENKSEEVKNFHLRSYSFNSRRDVSMSPPHSDDSSGCEISNLGASSLVQLWEKRLNHSKCTKPSVLASPGRTSFKVRCNRSAFSEEDQCDESPGSEESSPSWGSDKSVASGQSCSPRMLISDAAERESGRVADIIKRLTAINQMQSPVSMSDENDHDLCSRVAGSPYREHDRASPRVRGRLAFKDLLMQLERDRHGELNNLAERGAVSKFTQRGRIQALLRFKLLKRGVAACDQSREKSTASEVNRQSQGSAIMQLRERFSTGVEHRTSALAEVSDTRSPRKEIANSITELDNSPITQHLSEESGCRAVYDTDIHYAKTTQNSVLLTCVDNNKEEAHPSSDVTFQGPCFEAQNDDPKEIDGASSFMVVSNANEMANKVDSSDQQYANTETNYDEIVEDASYPQYAESSYYEIEEEDQNYDEASYDWISPISRPRSYWEERRQEWYREMLHFSSDNQEIRNLLERRTVSTSLSSAFRARIDSLVKSQVVAQTRLVRSLDNEEENEGSMDQLMAFFHERLHSRGSSPEEGRDDEAVEEEKRRNEVEEEEEKAEESISSGSDHELNDYFDQSSPSSPTSSPSLLRTWSFRDNEVGDDSDRVASSSSPPTLQSQSFYQDSQHSSSSTSHHSIEMEFLYGLRGQIDKLFCEMSELRKTFQSCMDMQMQLQQSNYQEVHAVKEEEFHDKTPRKVNCRICNEKKVNSVLYRCGHMCACLKCANELQRNDGRCPICRAPIVDVVLVYADT